MWKIAVCAGFVFGGHAAMAAPYVLSMDGIRPLINGTARIAFSIDNFKRCECHTTETYSILDETTKTELMPAQIKSFGSTGKLQGFFSEHCVHLFNQSENKIVSIAMDTPIAAVMASGKSHIFVAQRLSTSSVFQRFGVDVDKLVPETVLGNFPADSSDFEIAPDGNSFCYLSGGAAYLYDLNSNGRRPISNCERCLLLKNTLAVFSAAEKTWTILNKKSLKPLKSLAGSENSLYASQDGMMLFSSRDFTIYVVLSSSDSIEWSMKSLRPFPAIESVWSAQFSRDNAHLYILSSHSVKPESGEMREKLTVWDFDLANGEADGKVLWTEESGYAKICLEWPGKYLLEMEAQ